MDMRPNLSHNFNKQISWPGSILAQVLIVLSLLGWWQPPQKRPSTDKSILTFFLKFLGPRDHFQSTFRQILDRVTLGRKKKEKKKKKSCHP